MFIIFITECIIILNCAQILHEAYICFYISYTFITV